MPRHDPLHNYRFRVEIDSLQAGAFSEVIIEPTTTEAIDYRDGTDPAHVRKLPGLTKFGNVTLKRGVSTSLELFNWHRQVVSGAISSARRNVVIIVLNEAGQDVARFQISDAWPTKFDPGDLNAKGNEVFIESLELANEGIERVS